MNLGETLDMFAIVWHIYARKFCFLTQDVLHEYAAELETYETRCEPE